MPTMKMPGAWRFAPPKGCEPIPWDAVLKFLALAMRVAAQGDRWRVIEHFKSSFAGAAGASSMWSSSESWAESDLQDSMMSAASNPPLFLEAFWLGCEGAREEFGLDIPEVQHLNAICEESEVGFRVAPPSIVLAGSASTPVAAATAPPTVSEKAATAWQESRHRAEQLLAEGRPREAVQEMLWILESLATGFRGLALPKGEVKGKYFNKIMAELRASHPGTTLDRVGEWCESLHGYLSSPTGGGVRHGLDINAGVEISAAEGRLMCNLITSYIGFLLSEHERLAT
jgi:hypothetical protein